MCIVEFEIQTKANTYLKLDSVVFIGITEYPPL